MTSIQEYLNLFSEEISEYENETTASIGIFFLIHLNLYYFENIKLNKHI